MHEILGQDLKFGDYILRTKLVHTLIENEKNQTKGDSDNRPPCRKEETSSFRIIKDK